MKTLLLLRHAKTHTGDAFTQDHARTLTERGIRDAEQMAQWLVKAGLTPDRVLCSSSTRTRQTWDALRSALGNEFEVNIEDRLYLASAEDLLRRLQELPNDTGTVLLIGHNPGIHQLCLMLSANGDQVSMQAVEIKFPTCALAKISINCEDWLDAQEGEGLLETYYCPGDNES